MTDREKLIEEAAKAMLDESHGDGTWEVRTPSEERLYLNRARAALAVFEKAHTPSATEVEVIGKWFTSSHGVAVAAVAPMTDRGPGVMVDGRVISPNDVAALVEFKAQGEPSSDYEAGYAEGFHHGVSSPRGSADDDRAQGEPSDAPKRLVHEVNMMLNSVASHGPHALTDTSDRMYTVGLLRRLRDAIYPKPAQHAAAGNAVRAEMARSGLDVHRMVLGQEIAHVLASAALDASLAAVTEQGENR